MYSPHFLCVSWQNGADVHKMSGDCARGTLHELWIDRTVHRFSSGDHRMKLWTMSLILFIGSLAVTAVLWALGLPFFFLFLFLPLIPFFRKSRTVRRCPACGWETTGSERFCPYDATPLTGIGDGRE